MQPPTDPPAADPVAQLLLPTFSRVLAQALHELRLGVRHADRGGLAPAAFWRHRLAPDMLCLAHQLQVLADGVQGTLAQLRGEPDHPCAGLVFNRGEALLPPPLPDLDAAQALLLAAAQAVERGVDAPGAGRLGAVVHVARPGQRRSFTRDAFLWHYVLPNTLFHASLVHALLRHLGVPLGKADFMGADAFVVSADGAAAAAVPPDA